MAVKPGEEFNLSATPSQELLRKLAYLAEQDSGAVLTGSARSGNGASRDTSSKGARTDMLLQMARLADPSYQAMSRRIIENLDVMDEASVHALQAIEEELTALREARRKMLDQAHRDEQGRALAEDILMSTARSFRRLAFVGASLTAILWALSISAQTERADLYINDHRPVAEAVLELARRYPTIVTYEDPRYIYSGDILDPPSRMSHTSFRIVASSSPPDLYVISGNPDPMRGPATATMIWSASVFTTRFALCVTMITCRFCFAAWNNERNDGGARVGG